MSKSLVSLATAGAFATLIALTPAFAQPDAGFDSKKFFDELGTRSVSMPQGFDSKKFFDELNTKSVNTARSSTRRLSSTSCQSRGVKMPAGFDGKKFFSDIASTARNAPHGRYQELERPPSPIASLYRLAPADQRRRGRGHSFA